MFVYDDLRLQHVLRSRRGDSGPAVFEAVSGFYLPGFAGFNFAHRNHAALAADAGQLPRSTARASSPDSNQRELGTDLDDHLVGGHGQRDPGDAYLVSIYELSPADDNTARDRRSPSFRRRSIRCRIGLFYTTGDQAFKLPAIVLQAETSDASHWYFATIDAEVTATGATGVDKTISPFETGTSYCRTSRSSPTSSPPGLAPAAPSTCDLAACRESGAALRRKDSKRGLRRAAIHCACRWRRAQAAEASN